MKVYTSKEVIESTINLIDYRYINDSTLITPDTPLKKSDFGLYNEKSLVYHVPNSKYYLIQSLVGVTSGKRNLKIANRENNPYLILSESKPLITDLGSEIIEEGVFSDSKITVEFLSGVQDVDYVYCETLSRFQSGNNENVWYHEANGKYLITEYITEYPKIDNNGSRKKSRKKSRCIITQVLDSQQFKDLVNRNEQQAKQKLDNYNANMSQVDKLSSKMHMRGCIRFKDPFPLGLEIQSTTDCLLNLRSWCQQYRKITNKGTTSQFTDMMDGYCN